METQNLVLQWICVGLLAILLIGTFTWSSAPVIDCPICPILPELEVPEVNLTGVEGRLTEIEATLDEDDNWEDEAEALATEEWERRDYKDLFNWMSNVDKGNFSIDEREDIDRVVVKDIIFDDMNADNENAKVTQKLKVYYEDKSGDDKKAYITVVTTIEEGEVEDQSFSN